MGGNCSGAHGNSRREGKGLHLDGVFLVNTVVTVNEIVHFRFALCFTLCVFGLSRKKNQK